jgi:subtilisin family serine protease
MKQTSKLLVSVASLALLGQLVACRPAQKDPPFAGPANRLDVDVSKVKVTSDNPIAAMSIPELWKKSTGKNPDGSRVIVAIIGTGIDYTIPELRDSLWVNTGEMGEEARTDLTDSDGNGYADDLFGYDFFSGDGLPFDWHGHDTYIASLIAASGKTDPAVVGSAPNAAIMPIRYLGPDGSGSGIDAAYAIEYAVMNNAKIIYLNWPAGGFAADHVNLVLDALKTAARRNILVVVPAGNTSNKDVPGLITEAAKIDQVVVVSGVDHEGRITRTSNYGRNIASVAAPSMGSIGLYPGGEVSRDLQTTSVAAGYVAGAAALISTLPGKGSALEVKKALLSTTDDRNRDNPLDVLSQGVLNVSKLIRN